MTDKEKRIVMAVFGTLIEEHDFNELNSEPFSLGSLTIKEMQEMYSRLRYEDYCSSHGIRYEDMTEEDFIDAQMEEHGY